jgi:iron(II)-dependent oxidoreductase
VGRQDAFGGDRRTELAERLRASRERIFHLIEGLSEDALNRVHSPLMSPIVWDLGHIATFEDLWLVQKAHGVAPLREDLGIVYDPTSAARPDRGQLPYLRMEDCVAYMEAVRERTLTHLEAADLSKDADELLARGFVYEMVLCHEMQHSETILQTLQIMTSDRYAPSPTLRLPAPGAPPAGEMVVVPGGLYEMGAAVPLRPQFSYDNERPRHARSTAAFQIDTTPVTNGQMAEFVSEGGYRRQEWWTDEGWEWKERHGVDMPMYWSRDGQGFAVRSFADTAPLDETLPVCHVSWPEATAYARFAGKRLPTEVEWEKAAAWNPGSGEKRRYPWGPEPADRERANLDQLAFGTAPAGSYPDGASPCGALQMIGDVWEWTASTFGAYPGFRAFPYREYSEEFFGGPYRVLRGGAWATQPGAVTITFRNWDLPERRQLFAGFRCAADLEQ